MDIKESLHKGLGRALIQMEKEPTAKEYENALLECCLKNISYDMQSEGSKGYFLYQGICILNKQEEFEDILIETFLKQNEHNFEIQLFDILTYYISDGYKKSLLAVKKKYNFLVSTLPYHDTFSYSYCERELLEQLAIYLYKLENETFLLNALLDFERMLSIHKDCIFFDDLFDYIYKTNITILEQNSEKFPNLFDTYRNLMKTHNKSKKQREFNKIDSFKKLISLPKSSTSRLGNMFQFAKFSNEEEILKLAMHMESLPLEDFLYYLPVFYKRTYPLDVSNIIQILPYLNDDETYQVHNALSNIRDSRIHDLAITYLIKSDIDGLDLLANNYENDDIKLIESILDNFTKLEHSTICSLIPIFNQYKIDNCYHLLLRLYEESECTTCRYNVVKCMIYQENISDAIINECLYDSYFDTRLLVNNIKRPSLCN